MGKIKLPIHDILVVAREVEIPDTCPECGVDLHTSLQAIEHQTFMRHVDVNKMTGELEYFANVEGYDGEYSALWRCAKCSYELANSNEIDLDDESGRPVPQIVKDIFSMMDQRTVDGRRP